MFGWINKKNISNLGDLFVDLLKKKKTIVIKFPERVTFEHGDDKGFFDKFIPIINSQSGDLIIFDFENSKFIYPSVLMFMASLSETLDQRDNTYLCRLKENQELHEYLSFAGFDLLIKIPEFPVERKTLTSEVIKLKIFNQLEPSEKMGNDLADLIISNQSVSSAVEINLRDSLIEIFRNIIQHSSSTKTYVIAQVYPESKRIRFTIYDNGIGIREHITRKKYEDTHRYFKKAVDEPLFVEMKENSHIAIREAARYTVSGTDYENNSGAGLSFLIDDLSRPTNGEVYILSEDGFAKWKSGELIDCYRVPYKIKGTLISCVINFSSNYTLKYNTEKL